MRCRVQKGDQNAAVFQHPGFVPINGIIEDRLFDFQDDVRIGKKFLNIGDYDRTRISVFFIASPDALPRCGFHRHAETHLDIFQNRLGGGGDSFFFRQYFPGYSDSHGASSVSLLLGFVITACSVNRKSTAPPPLEDWRWGGGVICHKPCSRFFPQPKIACTGNTIIKLLAVQNRNTLSKAVSQRQAPPAVIAGAA
jgi:hypothetical protein